MIRTAAPRLVWFAMVTTAAAASGSCRRIAEDPAPAGSIAMSAGDRSESGSKTAVLDVVRDIDHCALGHLGVLMDFGDASMRADLHPGVLGRGDEEIVEHGGATWLRVRSRVVTASFYWPALATDSPDASAYVEARMRGGAARGVAVTIDGKSLGTWSLGKGETRTVVARAVTPVTLAPGGHELGLRFVGGSRGGDPLADVDWVHVGLGDPAPAYAAPTRGDVLVDETVGGRSMRAVSIHSPGFIRCSGWIPANATVEASLATAGGGDADVEARLLRDRQAPVILGTAHVTGGGAGWASWSVPITGLEGDGALASIELAVRRAGPATRMLFGAPRVVATRSASAPPPPRSRGVVLVVLGSTSARSMSLWGGGRAVPELKRLASLGTLFLANRASSALANATVAAMLTGLPPPELGLVDLDARLPSGPTTIAEACRQAGVSTAMFTANPTTGEAFGFERGWDSFVEHDPLEDVAATRVFDEAAAWIEDHKGDRFLVVVHARGGHPPWDSTPDELKTMPPPGYLGMLEPHRAAEALAKARRRGGHLKEDDRVRAWALYERAVDAHDEALGRLLAAIRAAGRDDDTTVIVTGDVAASESTPVPFVDADGIDEPLLATPLVVRWPKSDALAGRSVDVPTSPDDLARTVLAALSLSPPATVGGIDLALIAAGQVVPEQRALAASFAGHFAVRWGPFVLLGSRGRETRMCDLSLDPTCVADVRATSPIALEPLHRWAIEALAPAARSPFPREGIALDPHTTAVLTRWGRDL